MRSCKKDKKKGPNGIRRDVKYSGKVKMGLACTVAGIMTLIGGDVVSSVIQNEEFDLKPSGFFGFEIDILTPFSGFNNQSENCLPPILLSFSLVLSFLSGTGVPPRRLVMRSVSVRPSVNLTSISTVVSRSFQSVEKVALVCPAIVCPAMYKLFCPRDFIKEEDEEYR